MERVVGRPRGARGARRDTLTRRASALAALLACSACWNLFNLLPPLPAATCTTAIEVTALAATDAGAANVTFGCSQGPASACDGGGPPPCPANACVEVDWISVGPGFNGNCSGAGTPKALATASQCVALGGDAGATLTFAASLSVPVPFLIVAHLGDGGAPACDATCVQAALNCACDEALAGTPGQACTTLK